jgi:hypothetical protein
MNGYAYTGGGWGALWAGVGRGWPGVWDDCVQRTAGWMGGDHGGKWRHSGASSQCHGLVQAVNAMDWCKQSMPWTGH